MPPTAGRVVLDDEPLDYSSRKSVRAARDKMAIVFQQYNLFQNMDVLRNVTIAPIKIKRLVGCGLPSRPPPSVRIVGFLFNQPAPEHLVDAAFDRGAGSGI